MENAWRKLKVLIAGCGHIGKQHARILSSFGMEGIMAYDKNPHQLESLLNELPNVIKVNSFESGIEQADVTFILTPSKLHVPMALQALKAGCHLFIEKPLSINMAGISELEQLANDKDKKVMVGLCLRYHEGIIKIRQLLNEGIIGRLISLRALVGEHFPDVHPEYKSLYYAKYSGAFELMHDLDLVLWFADQPVKNVYSVFGSYSDIGIEAPDTVEFLLGFEDRCTATVHLDFFQLPRRRSMELIGTNGVIIIEFASWDEYTISRYDNDLKQWEVETCSSDRDDMFRNEDREFLESVYFDRVIHCDISEGCRSIKIIEAAQSGITRLQ